METQVLERGSWTLGCEMPSLKKKKLCDEAEFCTMLSLAHFCVT